MKRFALGLILAAAMVVAALASSPQTAQADHNRFLPALPTPTMKRVLERGYGLYCLNRMAAGMPNFRAQMQTVYADEYARVGIPWYEDTTGTSCDIIHQMVSGANFPCGSGAAACIYYYNDPVVVYYLADLLYSDWKTTIGHEHGHWDGSHERYRDSGGLIQCTYQVTTRNDCGSGTWWVTDYDLFVAWNTMVPDAPRTTGFVVPGNGFGYVTWDQYRADCAHAPNSVLNGVWTNIPPGGPAHFSCKNDVATRVSFGHSATPDSPVEWVGYQCGPEYNWCYGDPKQGWAGFYAGWGGCFWLRMENTPLWWVPQISAPYFWTLAGCF